MKRELNQKDAYKEGIEFQFVEPISLGPIISYSYLHDPIHMSFVLSRYKFIARMLTGKNKVLEIGCGDAFGTPLVAQFVKQLIAYEIDSRYVENNKKRLSKITNIQFEEFNICEKAPPHKFDAIYSVDVIEHLDKRLTKPFIENAVESIDRDGVYMVGTPNITSNRYASLQSKIQHINLFSHKRLRSILEKYFKNVFMFSMNDEVVHTGFGSTAHYFIGMGVGKRI